MKSLFFIFCSMEIGVAFGVGLFAALLICCCIVCILVWKYPEKCYSFFSWCTRRKQRRQQQQQQPQQTTSEQPQQQPTSQQREEEAGNQTQNMFTRCSAYLTNCCRRGSQVTTDRETGAECVEIRDLFETEQTGIKTVSNPWASFKNTETNPDQKPSTSTTCTEINEPQRPPPVLKLRKDANVNGASNDEYSNIGTANRAGLTQPEIIYAEIEQPHDTPSQSTRSKVDLK